MVCWTDPVLIAIAQLALSQFKAVGRKGPWPPVTKFHIHLEIHCNIFCSAPCLFQRNMRQKAVKPRCHYSLIKWTSLTNSGFASWGNPLAWQCHAGLSSSYRVCRSHLPDTEHRAWPWTMGSQYSSWSIPLAIPVKGEADLTRWIQGLETRWVCTGVTTLGKVSNKPKLVLPSPC